MLTGIKKLIARSFGFNWPSDGNAFDAAGHGDRWPLSSQIWSPVSQSSPPRSRSATRADWLANNSPTAAAYLAMLDRQPCRAQARRSAAKHPDEATRRSLEKSWARFATRCDAEGTGDLAGFLTKAVRNWVITGESFVQMPIVDRRLKLRLINTEQVWRPLTRMQPNGNRIFPASRSTRAAKRSPIGRSSVQMDLPWAVYPLPERIGVDDMLHVFSSGFPRRGARLVVLHADRGAAA